MKLIHFFVLLGLSTLVQAKDPIDSLSSYCSLSKACLAKSPEFCTPAQLLPNPDINYNIGFCDESKILENDGINFTGTNRKPWVQLGRPLRIEYEESGMLPLRHDAIEYLIQHLPLAVELVNAYQSTQYTVQYRNPSNTSFKAANGRNLSGEFEFLNTNIKGHHILYGVGIAALPGPLSILFAGGKSNVSLRGDALVFLDFKDRGEKSSWQMRLVVFPDDNAINKVMGMGIFRNKVSAYIQEIIGDISKSAAEYTKGNRAPVVNSALFKSTELSKQLREFEDLLKPKAP